MDICYRLPEQKEEIDEAFFIQLEETLYLQTLVLMGDFNHPPVRITTDVNIRDSLGYSDGGIQDPESRVQGKKAGSQPLTSGEQTLACSGTCLEESHGIWPWRATQESCLIFKDHLLH